MAGISDSLVDALISDMALGFPDHVPGTRPIHSTGIGVAGEFRSSSVASRYCIADQFDGSWVPVTVRFSNGNGQPDPDGRLQVRGMAVKFFVGGTRGIDRSTEHTARFRLASGERIEDLPVVQVSPDRPVTETDLVCMSVPTFMAQEAEKVLEFERAYRAKPVRRPSLYRRIKSLVTMSPIPPQEVGVSVSGNDGVLKWSKGYVPGQGFVMANSMQRLPASYCRSSYHAVHAFKIEDPDGVHRMVRFSLEPSDGVKSAGPPEPLLPPIAQALRQDRINAYGAKLPSDYLRRELRERLDSAPSRFNLRMQIADPRDDTADPTKAWPLNRRRVLMGSITLTHVLDDQVNGCEEMSFNPGRLLSGMEMSDDPVLRDRVAVYEESYRRRMSVRQGGPAAVPGTRVGCPMAPT